MMIVDAIIDTTPYGFTTVLAMLCSTDNEQSSCLSIHHFLLAHVIISCMFSVYNSFFSLYMYAYTQFAHSTIQIFLSTCTLQILTNICIAVLSWLSMETCDFDDLTTPDLRFMVLSYGKQLLLCVYSES